MTSKPRRLPVGDPGAHAPGGEPSPDDVLDISVARVDADLYLGRSYGGSYRGMHVSKGPGASTAPVARAFSFVISRALGTVIVTTHGVLDQPGALALGEALLDLVDHQGNLAVIVDLADLCLSDHLSLVSLAPAAAAAARRGGLLTLADPSAGVGRALIRSGLVGLVSVTTDRRPCSPHHSSTGPRSDEERRAAMAQHPAGSARTPAAGATNTHGEAQ